MSIPSSPDQHQGSRALSSDTQATHYSCFAEAASLIALVTLGPHGPETVVWDGTGCRVQCYDGTTITLTGSCAGQHSDWQRNIARDHRVQVLFVVGGVSYVLRICGRARLPAACAGASGQNVQLLPVLLVSVEQAHFEAVRHPRASTASPHQSGDTLENIPRASRGRRALRRPMFTSM